MSLKRVSRNGLTSATQQLRSVSLFIVSGISGIPTALAATASTTATVSLSWSAPSYVGDTAITSYIVTNTAAAGTVAYTGTTAVVSGLTASTSYTFQVVAVNTQGNSEPSATLTTSTSAYNAATGGSVQTFARTGLGTWKSHTFTSTGTLAVTVANEAFSGVALAGGQGGGYSHPADPRGPGSNGGASSSTTLTIATGNTTCTVGGGGGGGQGTHQSGNPGGASSIGSYLSSGGGSVTVAFYNGSNTTWAGNGYGGGGAAAYLSPGATGQGGIVFVAYRSS